MDGDTFKGYVDIIDMVGKEFTDKGEKDIPIPDDMMDMIEPMRTMLVEAVAETSEELMENTEGEEFISDEIHNALRQGVVEGEIVPVLCGSAINNLAITPLLDIMVAYMPSPAERVATKGLNLDTEEEEERKADPKEPFSAFVFKTVIDPFVGKLSLFKVKSGILTADTELYNSNKDSSEKINSIYVLRGKKQIQVDELTTGDIGAIAKLQVTETGDTLCERGAPIKFSQFEFPEPAISLAIEAEIQGEEDKVMTDSIDWQRKIHILCHTRFRDVPDLSGRCRRIAP